MAERLDPSTREAAARANAFREFDRLYPGIRGNPWIPSWPHPPQLHFLGMHVHAPPGDVFEALYGGAAGGGKSQTLAYAHFQMAHLWPRYRGLVTRRSFPDLALPDSIMQRMVEIATPRGARWNDRHHFLKFPNGAVVQFRPMEAPRAHIDLAGSAFHTQTWDELTHHPREDQYLFMFSRCRRLTTPEERDIPLRMLSGSNPGNAGHEWVRRRFVGGWELDGTYAPPLAHFLPAKATDNPSLDVEAYLRTLAHLPPLLQQQLRDGSWEAREPGKYFPSAYFGPLLDPVADAWPQRDKVTVRAWDFAASEAKDAAYTAGVKLSRHRSGVYAVEDCISFKATPGPRDQRIIQAAEMDGHAVTVLLEVEPGSGGISQVATLAAQLEAKGFAVEWERPRVKQAGKSQVAKDREEIISHAYRTIAGKAGRADPVSACAWRGWILRGECNASESPDFGREAHLPPSHQSDGIRLYRGAWTRPFLSILEPFPSGATCDEVDALSHAWSWLAVNSFGRREPSAVAPRAKQQTEEQREDLEAERKRAGAGGAYAYRETSNLVRHRRKPL